MARHDVRATAAVLAKLVTSSNIVIMLDNCAHFFLPETFLQDGQNNAVFRSVFFSVPADEARVSAALEKVAGEFHFDNDIWDAIEEECEKGNEDGDGDGDEEEEEEEDEEDDGGDDAEGEEEAAAAAVDAAPAPAEAAPVPAPVAPAAAAAAAPAEPAEPAAEPAANVAYGVLPQGFPLDAQQVMRQCFLFLIKVRVVLDVTSVCLPTMPLNVLTSVVFLRVRTGGQHVHGIDVHAMGRLARRRGHRGKHVNPSADKDQPTPGAAGCA